MNRSLVAIAILSGTVFACSGGGGGGSSGPSNSVTGTIGGQTIDIKSGAIIPSENFGNSTAAVVILSDKPDLCAQAKLGNFTPSSTWFEIELAVASSTGGSFTAATQPGDYVVNSAVGDFSQGVLFNFDAQCHTTGPTLATAGSAIVTSFSSSGAKGTANLSFGSDNVTATFDVESCPELLTLSICQ